LQILEGSPGAPGVGTTALSGRSNHQQVRRGQRLADRNDGDQQGSAGTVAVSIVIDAALGRVEDDPVVGVGSRRAGGESARRERAVGQRGEDRIVEHDPVDAGLEIVEPVEIGVAGRTVEQELVGAAKAVDAVVAAASG
jgi:hypothetical protein